MGCVWAAGTEQKTMHMTSYRYTVYLKCKKYYLLYTVVAKTVRTFGIFKQFQLFLLN